MKLGGDQAFEMNRSAVIEAAEPKTGDGRSGQLNVVISGNMISSLPAGSEIRTRYVTIPVDRGSVNVVFPHGTFPRGLPRGSRISTVSALVQVVKR